MNTELINLALAAIDNPDTRFVESVHSKLQDALQRVVHPGHGGAWTEQDDEFLRRHYKSMQYKAIAKKLKRTANGVRNRVMLLKLEPKHSEWSETEIAALVNMKPRDAASALGRTLGACRMKLRKLEKES